MSSTEISRSESEKRELDAREKRIRTFERQAKKVLKAAKDHGLEHDFYFATVFHTFEEQIHILHALSEKIWELGVVIEKEYVKGRPNLCSNPALQDFNRTATAANSTVATLMSIIKTFSRGAEAEAESKLDKLRRQLEE